MAKTKRIGRRGFLQASTTGTLLGAAAAASAATVKSSRAVQVGNRGMIPYMQSGEPFLIRGKRMVFTNYHYIRNPSLGWYNDLGQNITVNGTAGPNDAHIRIKDNAWGIRIVAQRGERSLQSTPAMEPIHPWEKEGVQLGQTIYDAEDAFYKSWGYCSVDGKPYRCFLQSEDFEHWERPELGVVEFNGTRKNNLTDLPSVRLHIFKDPSSRSERWKWFAGEIPITRAAYMRFQKSRPFDWDPRAERADIMVDTEDGRQSLIFGVKGGVSTDGHRWKTLPELLSVEHSDTINTCYYDVRRAKYVAYMRTWVIGDHSQESSLGDHGASWALGRRSIGRAETDDFSRFPLSESILTPGPDNVGPSDSLYTNCHTFVPSAPDQHLFFPTIWHQANDSTDVAVASSLDGKLLHWLPGNPVVSTGPPGEWDGGCVFATGDLLELPDGRWLLPYQGNNVPHKYPRKGGLIRGHGYATWKRGRLIALEATERGQFSTFLFIPPGRKIQVNALTLRGGGIRAEIVDYEGKIVPGRSFEDCPLISGDHYKTPITWNGGDDIGVGEGKPIRIRFQLDQAKLYFLDFA